MLKLFKLISILAALSSSFQALAEPVIVGGDGVTDACPSIGAVKAKKFIYLKESPMINAKVIDRLPAGSQLYICGSKASWYSVVVISKEKTNCGVSSPIKKKSAYSGPCRSGWVETRQVELLAG